MSHPPAFRSAISEWLSLRAYGIFTSALFRAHTPPEVMRARFERFARVSREALRAKHPALVFEDHAIGSLPMERVCAVAAPRAVVLHLHGGAFFFGSLASYRNRAMRLSYRLDAEVFVPDYRLAPEHPFPAALEDALVSYQYLRALRPEAPLFITGDSAGGGLALSLMLRLRELRARMPTGAILLSPWTDLSGTSTRGRPRSRDLWLTPRHLTRWASYYAGSADRRDPALSPRFADFAHLPPFLLLVGEHEILRDEAEAVVARAQEAGADARLLVGERMQHDFPLTLPWLEASRVAWRAMKAFVDERCTTQSRTAGAASPSASSPGNRALPAAVR